MLHKGVYVARKLAGRWPPCSWPCIVHRIAHRTAPPPAASAS
eukprot:COSAG06_NODE_50793_length_316_cov_0.718894_1_plen_41_part_10